MMSEHLRMGGVYWGVSAMALLRRLDDAERIGNSENHLLGMSVSYGGANQVL